MHRQTTRGVGSATSMSPVLCGKGKIVHNIQQAMEVRKKSGEQNNDKIKHTPNQNQMAPRAQVYHNLLPTTTLPTPAGLVCGLASDEAEALTPKWHTPLLLASAYAAAAAAAASDAAGAGAAAHQRQVPGHGEKRNDTENRCGPVVLNPNGTGT
ncbi:hypothetical protein LZ31DRAFT_363415 [Colletotrichum somersetense]|nr:hypothetical protein LZ31DRAFT_363415 [Colletotrichum somersetense]